MMMKTLVLVILSATVSYGRTRHSSRECTNSEHQQMQDQFNKCRMRFSDQFYKREFSSICTLLDKQMEICGQIWNQCHTKHEIGELKSMHTSRFIEQHRNNPTLEKCPKVQKHRESLLMGPDYPEEEGCSEEETKNAMFTFSNNCSHPISQQVYEDSQDVASPEKVIYIFCTALHNISTMCPVHLEMCYAPEDLDQILDTHLDQMKLYFIGLAADKISQDALDDCEKKLKDKSFMSPSVRDVSPTESPTPVLNDNFHQHRDNLGGQDREAGGHQKNRFNSNEDDYELMKTIKDDDSMVDEDMSGEEDNEAKTIEDILRLDRDGGDDDTTKSAGDSLALPNKDQRPAGVRREQPPPAAATSADDGSSGCVGMSPASYYYVVLALSLYFLSIWL